MTLTVVALATAMLSTTCLLVRNTVPNSHSASAALNCVARALSGGKKVLALCVPALVLLVVAYVCVGIYRFNKTAISMCRLASSPLSLF
jgi:hypothetical protein